MLSKSTGGPESSERAIRERAASVTLAGVRKRFGSVTAVDNVDLRIEPGQFVTLLGPSGCGKTTTLNMVAGLDLPSEGRILIGDRDVTLLPPQERDVAMVFQSYALYPHLSVRDNIAFPLRARRRRAARDEIQRRVAYASGVLGLEDLLERYPRQLSGGQRQRVALGRAMVRTPTAYLLDEPLSNLDQQLRVQMRSELKDLHARLGATMIYVTHDQGEAMILSDQIAIMSNGSVQQIGTPYALYRRPANLFVARFLGEPGMNLVPGQVQPAGGAFTFTAPGVSITLPDWPAAWPREVVLGVRPEGLTLGTSTQAVFHARVQALELLGPRAMLRAEVEGQKLIATLPPDAHFLPGAAVQLCVPDLGDLSWFDVKSQALLQP